MAMLRNAAEEASRAGLAYFDVIAGAPLGGHLPNGVDHAHGLGNAMVPQQPHPHVSMAMARAMTEEPEAAGDLKRKRKRNIKPKDPNAPKKPATPYFLFCSAGRETVKRDLGATSTFQDVQNELKARWEANPDKQSWSDLYQKLLADWKSDKANYDVKKAAALADDPNAVPQPLSPAVASAPAVPASYSGGFTAVNHPAPTVPVVSDDDEDEEMADEHEAEAEAAVPAPAPAAPEPEAEAAEPEETPEDASSDSSLTPPPEKPKATPKTRKPRATPAKAAAAKAAAAAAAAAAKDAAKDEAPAPAPETKKRKSRAKKTKEPEPEPEAEPEEPAAAVEVEETPKRKGRKRRKSGNE
ncbi:hypothetical protein EDC01DRAFT_193975 [Geopyxis carbonaria]|nr:hypothetical protein EDC01DRAFT_193975 [Geopyxis carbonaria]